MILILDIGNSNIVYGVYSEGQWQHHWREETHTQDSPSDLQNQLRAQFSKRSLAIKNIEKVILSSVVPDRTSVHLGVLESLFTGKVMLVDSSVFIRLPLAIKSPHEIGSDLVANAMAGAARFPRTAFTVVDFGTALTFTTVSSEREILGVSIAPGIKTSIKSLFLNAAQLPEVPLNYPDSVLGSNTIHAIQSGVLIGYTGMVKYMIEQIKSELQEEINTHHKVIATGGLSGALTPLRDIFDEIDPMFTLDGLRIIAEYCDKQD